MTDGKSTSRRFEDYRPSKTVLFWSCAGCIVATLIIGFSLGGWVTGGTAREMAEGAAGKARAQVAAAVCVEKFTHAADARPQLASLKEISSSWKRQSFIRDGGWTTVAGEKYNDAAELCADQLMTTELPPAQEAATTEAGAVAQ
jgi:hypothetical protein